MFFRVLRGVGARLEAALPLAALARTVPARELAVEVSRAAIAVILAARARRALAPRDALAAMRARGARCEARGPDARARLRVVVTAVDALVPPRPNCYRRVLAESALDRGAAAERVVLGLHVGRTGHAYFRSDPSPPPASYDVEFDV